VLDLGCGPGLLTLPAAAAASSAGRVVAVDANPGMLARGAARTSPATNAAPISWVRSHDGALPVGDDAVDKVVCGAKLQHFADAGAAIAEVRRVLRPGGRFSVSAWGTLEPDAVETAVLDAFGRHGLRDACTRRTELSVGGRLVPAADLPELVESAGLQVTHVAAATVTVPFLDAIAYTRWRLSFPRTCAALVGREDAAAVRADVLEAVVGAHGASPVLLELPVHYTVSRAG
jgi:SAM-dependent methyltransferase